MTDSPRRTWAWMGYVLVSIVAVVAGFVLVQFVAGSTDETIPARSTDTTSVGETTSTTATTPTTEAPDLGAIADQLSGVADLDAALQVISDAPDVPAPGVNVAIGPQADVPAVASSTAFLASSDEAVELGAPFLRDPEGAAAQLPAGPKVVVMIALEEPIDEPTGVVAAVVSENPDETAVGGGSFAGATSVVAARLGLNDVIEGQASGDGFESTGPTGSVRIDGPLLTFVFEPAGPFRIVIVRGFDDDLDNFTGSIDSAGASLPTAGLRQLGDVAALID